MSDRPKGPLGIDPLHFSIGLFVLLVLYVFYLMLPRALRKQYFGAYAKRHAWSARSRSARRSYGQVREKVGVDERKVLRNLLWTVFDSAVRSPPDIPRLTLSSIISPLSLVRTRAVELDHPLLEAERPL